MVVLALLLRYTSLGRSIKATRANPELAQTIGISANQIYLLCFFIGTLLCGVAAFWYGLQFTIDPAMGFKPVIFAFVVAFLAGTASSPIRVFVDRHRRRPHRAVLVDLAVGAVDADRRLRRARRLPLVAFASEHRSDGVAAVQAGPGLGGDRADLAELPRPDPDLRGLRALAQPSAGLRRSGLGRERCVRRHRWLHDGLPRDDPRVELRADCHHRDALRVPRRARSCLSRRRSCPAST